jgi:hypothetical protein
MCDKSSCLPARQEVESVEYDFDDPIPSLHLRDDNDFHDPISSLHLRDEGKKLLGDIVDADVWNFAEYFFDSRCVLLQ